MRYSKIIGIPVRPLNNTTPTMRITGRQAIWLANRQANRNVSGCVGRKALSSKLPEKLQALEISSNHVCVSSGGVDRELDGN